MKRRNFIKSGSLAATAISLAGNAMGQMKHISKNDIINIGVIGTGSRGSGLIKTMQNIPTLRVAACCDVLPFRLDNAMRFADQHAVSYTNYHKMLDNKDLDAVLISTPLSMHHDMAVDALGANKHVYNEKTMTYNIEQALDLTKKVDKTDRIFQVGHQYHSSKLYANIIEAIRLGYVGNIMGIEAQWNRNGNWRRPVPDPSLERQINWRMYREFSCGLLAELSSHQIDFVNWVTESHPTQVIATGGIDYWKDGRETYDNIHAIFNYPGGVKATFRCMTSNAYHGYQIKVLGDKATVVIKPTSALIYPEHTANKTKGTVDGVSGATIPVLTEEGAFPVNGNHDDPSGQALQNFADSILYNKQPLSNVKTGATAAIAMRMALTAMLENRVVAWQQDYDTALNR